MNFTRILTLTGIAILTVGAWQAFGWPGIALAVGGVVMWVLMHFTRMVAILKKAADRPIGHVASAVMLNAKLQKGVTLMHVIAMTRSLGLLQTEKDTQPEVYTWTDTSDSVVTCTFVGGKLTEWTLVRPEERPEVTSEVGTPERPEGPNP